MSKYTTEVRFICESLAGLEESEGYNSVNSIIESARPKIFNFDYPIFDVNYKPLLERKILKHYYTREICEETYGLWHLRLDALMNEIMPYYNKLYESELLEFNPFDDIKKRIEHEGTDSGESNEAGTTGNTGHREGTGSSTKTGENEGNKTGTSTETMHDNVWNLFSDTPQGGIEGIVSAYDDTLPNNTYLTDARNIKDDRTTDVEYQEDTTNQYSETTSNQFEEDASNVGTSTTDRTFANENAWTEVISGKQGNMTYSKMLSEFRNTFLNIDMEIIKNLRGLFMQLY